MYLDYEGSPVLCHECLNDYELRPVNQRTDNLVQQLTYRDISWVGQENPILISPGEFEITRQRTGWFLFDFTNGFTELGLDQLDIVALFA
jgi:hypothetical protein